MIQNFDVVILKIKMPSCPIAVYQSAARVGIDRTVLSAHEIEHDFGIVVELKTEPIPADLIRAELIAAELVIHPAQPAHFFCSAVNRQFALGSQARQRIIIGSPPSAFRLLTQAVF